MPTMHKQNESESIKGHGAMKLDYTGKESFSIKRETLSSAVKCRDNFSCLAGAKDCLCNVEDCLNGDIHFITPECNNSVCEYRMAFGYSYICRCPVRKEIYNNYQI